MALKHPMFFSAEIASIAPQNDVGFNIPGIRAAEPASYTAPPVENLVTHGERLFLMDDLEAIRLALSSGADE